MILCIEIGIVIGNSLRFLFRGFCLYSGKMNLDLGMMMFRFYPKPFGCEKCLDPQNSDCNTTYARLSALEDTKTFQLLVSSNKIDDSNGPPIDLTDVPLEYHDFSDVFDKAHASTLAPYRPYDLKLDLEEGPSPPFGPIYSLSQSELKSLQEF